MKILELGSSWNHGDRMCQAVTSTSGRPPPIYGLHKDHKKVKEGEEPPLRPVCSASSGPGSRISNILTMIIKPCNDQISDEYWLHSTEDLQAKIQELNELPAEQRSSLVTFSMDAVALFPNIQVEQSSQVVFDLIKTSSVEFKGINYLELARYLAVNLSEQEIIKYELEDLVMRRKVAKKGGRRPTVTGPAMIH